MTFQDAVRTVLTEKYAAFRGRASRSEYWWFLLAYVIGTVLVAFTGIYLLQLVYWLALIVPLAAVGFRRMQDTGRPGWYYFIPTIYWAVTSFFMPEEPVIDEGTGAVISMPEAGSVLFAGLLGLIGLVIAIIFLWWLTRPSEDGENAYGPPPAT